MGRDPIRDEPNRGALGRSGPGGDPQRAYGNGLAVVTVARSISPVVDAGTLRAATARPLRIVVTVVGDAAPETSDDGVEVLRLAEDIGRPAAINRAVAGLDAAIGWVVISDPEVQWEPGALDSLLAAAARYPRAALLGPRLTDATGTVVPSAGTLPSVTQVLRDRIPTAAGSGRTGWLSTSCVLVRRSAWDSVDGLDARYLGAPGPVDMADVDLGDRLGRAGWLLVHVPGVVITAGAGIRGGHDNLASHADGLHRYVHERGPASARLLLALTDRVVALTGRGTYRNIASRIPES
ncbi:glycosyltransferase family 2 protein [Pseudonocardia sp. CA-142604]|uniref:glycosyltransferase family 2 protein n=1 Tax=Pseudonocardia sp. CA-142604 TaxID=3240024 RepID=UPI003D92D789